MLIVLNLTIDFSLILLQEIQNILSVNLSKIIKLCHTIQRMQVKLKMMLWRCFEISNTFISFRCSYDKKYFVFILKHFRRHVVF